MTKSNITSLVTPPDFVDSEFHTVVMIDFPLVEIQRLGLWCQTSEKQYTVFLYNALMDNSGWLNKAIERADAILVNNNRTDLSQFKKTLKLHSTAIFFDDDDDVLEYFRNYDKESNEFKNA